MIKKTLIWMLVMGAMVLSLVAGLNLSQLRFSFTKQNAFEQNLESKTILNSTTLQDKDKDGIDDFTDIMLGARADALNMVTYDDGYYSGYPPENVGVCVDVIWRALMAAGYNLKDLIDADIAMHPSAYPGIEEPDPNIDFRRTRNLKVFFDRHLQKLTLNIYEIDQWLPGDIVIFFPDAHHIGIISDQRNFMGIPYLIHNTGQKDREEDIMVYSNYNATITGHYRWIYTP